MQQRYVTWDVIYFSCRLIWESGRRWRDCDVTKVNALLSNSNCESLAGKQMPIDPYSFTLTLPGWTTLALADNAELQVDNGSIN